MKSNNKKRKGIWIPIELIENKDLGWSNKALLSEIYSLHELERRCVASDQHFANLLGFKHRSSAQKRIDTLVDLGLVHRKVVYKNRKIIGKILTPLISIKNLGKIKNNNYTKEQADNSKLEDTSKKNISTDEEEQTNSIKKKNGVVPENPESSSSESDLVFPGSQNSSSSENIKNSFKNTLKNNTSGPIQDVNNIEGSSFSFKTLGINNPEGKKEFISAYKDYSNGSKYSNEYVQKNMAFMFQDIPNWERRIEKLGRDKFIESTEYSYNNIAGAKGMVAAFIDRLFQLRTK